MSGQSRTGVLEGLERALPLSGVVAVVLQAVAVVTMGLSGYRPRGADAVAIFTADPGRIEAGVLIGGFYGLVFLLLYVGTLAGSVHRATSDARLTAITLAGGVTATISLAIGYRVVNAGAFAAAGPDGIGADLATVLYRLYASTFAGFVSFGLAAMLGAAGLAISRARFLPNWLGWSGLGAAVVLMTPAHAFGEAFAVAWIVASGIHLARRPVG